MQLAEEGGLEKRGAVNTRREVVDFILDLIGYTVDQPLYQKKILEPSFGEGDFLRSIIERLLISWRESGRKDIIDDLSHAICAVELHRDTFLNTYHSVVSQLTAEIGDESAQILANRWLIHDDFLLASYDSSEFDFVVGNPPYVRQELICAPLLNEYRQRYKTLYDRADLYIPFIERSLSMLSKNGAVGFICTDRWMKNRYGGPLRNLISEHFHLKIYIDMVDTQAFHSKVSTYPAITIITRKPSKTTLIAKRPEIDKSSLHSLARTLANGKLPNNSDCVREISGITNGSEPWLLGSSDQMALIRRIEQDFAVIENAGCKVGIGVATGADKIFIRDYYKLDVESDRKLPLVTTKDINSGRVEWRGQGVINPFSPNGKLVNLEDYPKLACYLKKHKKMISQRHCAKKSPANWYRTIDRIKPDLAKKPKLLIPDIKGEAHIVYEEGKLYPHHNLYYVTSEQWDLQALQAVMLSAITRLFISTYSTKMRGGYLRFQAQYLRRIRLPYWDDVSTDLRKQLITAAINQDIPACDRAVFKLYDLNRNERSAIGGNGI